MGIASNASVHDFPSGRRRPLIRLPNAFRAWSYPRPAAILRRLAADREAQGVIVSYEADLEAWAAKLRTSLAATKVGSPR